MGYATFQIFLYEYVPLDFGKRLRDYVLMEVPEAISFAS